MRLFKQNFLKVKRLAPQEALKVQSSMHRLEPPPLPSAWLSLSSGGFGADRKGPRTGKFPEAVKSRVQGADGEDTRGPRQPAFGGDGKSETGIDICSGWGHSAEGSDRPGTRG